MTRFLQSAVTRLALLVAATAMFATGCIHTEQTYTLNPDGTGKVRHVVWAPLQGAMNFSNGEDSTDEDKAKKVVQTMLENSEGVVAWKDLDYAIEADKVKITAVAYFQDISKLQLKSSSMSGGTEFVPEITVADGAITVVVKDKSKKKDVEAPNPPLTDEQVKAKVTAEKAKFKQQMMMMTAFLAEFNVGMTFQMPGDLGEVVNFSRPEGAPRSASVRYLGPEMLNAMNAVADEPGFWEAQIKAGRNTDNLDMGFDNINGKLFGTKGPVKLVTKGPLKPQFDFVAEVEAANKAFPEMVKKFALAPIAAPAMVEKGDALEATTIGGVQLIYGADDDNALNPLNESNGLQLGLVGTMNGAILSVASITLDEAVADNGDSLLSDSDWDRKGQNISLSKDRTAYTFRASLKAPKPTVNGLKKLSGVLTYRIANAEKNAEVGPVALNEAAKDQEPVGDLGYVLLDVNSNRNSNRLELQFALPENSIKAVSLKPASGAEIPCKIEYANFWDDRSSVNVSFKGTMPEKATIVLTLHDDIKILETPWSVENVDLFGRPLK